MKTADLLGLIVCEVVLSMENTLHPVFRDLLFRFSARGEMIRIWKSPWDLSPFHVDVVLYQAQKAILVEPPLFLFCNSHRLSRLSTTSVCEYTANWCCRIRWVTGMSLLIPHISRVHLTTVTTSEEEWGPVKMPLSFPPRGCSLTEQIYNICSSTSLKALCGGSLLNDRDDDNLVTCNGVPYNICS